jgi:hypothetical protein
LLSREITCVSIGQVIYFHQWKFLVKVKAGGRISIKEI